VINVGGAATLSGTITPIFVGVSPSFGDSFQFLSVTGSVTNNGAKAGLPETFSLEPGLALQVVNDNSSASIRVSNLPILTLNRATGAASISNVVGGPISLTAYDIRSDLGLPQRCIKKSTKRRC
jgi:hypothetical protein